jgi:hypothetical protein
MSVATEPLRTDRTVARDLVHRAALEEVFLTDFRSQPGEGFAAAAVLPRAHHYYGDHTNRPDAHDPIAVFECARQMLLCAMHLHHGATPSTKSITATCRMAITDPRGLRKAGGHELEMSGTVPTCKEHDGVATRVVHDVDVLRGGRPVATVSVDTALRDPERYERLRMKFRSTPPPMSDTLVPAEPVARIPPSLVGRERPENVVLLEPRPDGEGLMATLRVPVSNSGMFDHPQDHVPGPVLMEAARQAGLLLLTERFGLAPSKALLVEVRADYDRFVELDSPIQVRAEPSPGPAPGTDQPISITFVQSGMVVTTMTIRFASTLDW